LVCVISQFSDTAVKAYTGHIQESRNWGGWSLIFVSNISIFNTQYGVNIECIPPMDPPTLITGGRVMLIIRLPATPMMAQKMTYQPTKLIAGCSHITSHREPNSPHCNNHRQFPRCNIIDNVPLTAYNRGVETHDAFASLDSTNGRKSRKCTTRSSGKKYGVEIT